jgi:hypothetical protein
MPHVSPSQASRWDLCPRWWCYDRDPARRGPDKPAAAFGSRAHTIAENWLNHGTPPDGRTAEGACIFAGIEWLPLPEEPGKVVEHMFREVIDGVEYTGRIDLLYGYEERRIITVCDHKTTGDLKHAMTLDGIKPDGSYDAEKDFRIDHQRVIYSHWAARFFDVEYVVAHWQYYRRKPPLGHPVVMVEHRDEIAKKFDVIHRRCSLPIIAAAGKEPEELPRNLAACGSFGGCPHRGECHVGVSPIDLAAAKLAR